MIARSECRRRKSWTIKKCFSLNFDVCVHFSQVESTLKVDLWCPQFAFLRWSHFQECTPYIWIRELKGLKLRVRNFQVVARTGLTVCDSSHEVATQTSHFVDRDGWQAKWLPLNFGYHVVMRTAPFTCQAVLNLCVCWLSFEAKAILIVMLFAGELSLCASCRLRHSTTFPHESRIFGGTSNPDHDSPA